MKNFRNKYFKYNLLSSAASTHISEQSFYLVSSKVSKLHLPLTEKGQKFLVIQNFTDQFSMNNSWSTHCTATNGLQILNGLSLDSYFRVTVISRLAHMVTHDIRKTNLCHLVLQQIVYK